MTDKVRKTVSFPGELEVQIARRAQRFDRSFSAQVVADMRTVIDQTIRRNKYHKYLPINDEQSNRELGGLDEQ